MDPSIYGDVEHFVVQLNGSDKSPRALKVTSISLYSMLALMTCILIRQSSGRRSRQDVIMWSATVDLQAWQKP